VDRAQAEDDLVIARDNAVVLVDPDSVPFLAGSEVDFRRRPDRRVVPGGQSECHRVVRLWDEFLDLIRQPELNYLLTLFAHDRID
jgi:hypothetical protein